MSKTIHTCPACVGKKGSVCHHNTGIDSSKHFWAWSDCFVCKGTGEVDSEIVENIAIGKKLRTARIASGLSLMDAARKYGVSPVTISGIENRGEHHADAPGFIALLKVAGDE